MQIFVQHAFLQSDSISLIHSNVLPPTIKMKNWDENVDMKRGVILFSRFDNSTSRLFMVFLSRSINLNDDLNLIQSD